MDATALAPDAPLPTDVASLQAMVRELLAEVARLRAENAELKAKLDAATKHRFGRRSERQKPAPVPTDPEPARRRDEHGRSALPDHLERRDVVHDLTDEQKRCPACGRVRECIGEQSAEQLDLDPPRFFVLRTRKRSYACRHCNPTAVASEPRVATAGPAQVGPIAWGLCGPGLLAHAITAKFADHVPVHRLAGQLSRSGVAVARSTLGDWLARAAGLLDPLVGLMHARLLRSRVIHADDTHVKLRVAKQDRTAKAHLWVAIGDADQPDGARLLASGVVGGVAVWDARPPRADLCSTGHAGALGPRVKTYPIHGGNNRFVFRGPALAWGPDGSRLVTAGEDGTQRLWDPAAGRELCVLWQHTGKVTAVAFSRDSRRLGAASSDGIARVWDARSGRRLGTLEGHAGALTAAAFSPDGSLVAPASVDGTARVWETPPGDLLPRRPVAVLENYASSLLVNEVTSVAWSPGGGRLVTGGRGAPARVWDARTWKPVATPAYVLLAGTT